MIPMSIFLGVLISVVYVSALSLWAFVSGHWSAWQVARFEIGQQADAKALEDNPVEERVVAHLVTHTDISAATPSSTGNAAPPVAQQHSNTDLRQRLSDIAAQLGELQRALDDTPSPA